MLDGGVLGRDGVASGDGVASDQLEELLSHHVPLISNAMLLYSMHLARPVYDSVNF